MFCLLFNETQEASSLSMEQFVRWFYIFLSSASAGFFGEQKARYIYSVLTKNYFAGHYLFISKHFLVLCLLNCSIVWSRISRFEGSNWTEIWSLSNIWVSFYFRQGMGIQNCTVLHYCISHIWSFLHS